MKMATSAEPQSPQQHVFGGSPPSMRSSRSSSPSRMAMDVTRGAAPFSTLAQMEQYLEREVPCIAYTAASSDLFADSLEVVRELFGWESAEVQLEQCKDGITNKLVRAKWVPTSKVEAGSSSSPTVALRGCAKAQLRPGASVLIRIYGKKSEVLIDRRTELLVSSALL